MDKVRLEVRATSRNSEKPKPKASTPPMLSKKSEWRRGEGPDARNNFSEVLRLNAGDRWATMRTEMLNSGDYLHDIQNSNASSKCTYGTVTLCYSTHSSSN